MFKIETLDPEINAVTLELNNKLFHNALRYKP